jgi:hypothetical protein
MGIQTSVISLTAKQIKIELINTLSAIGSHSLPKSLTHLFRRAKYPSNVSVKQAITKKIPAKK